MAEWKKICCAVDFSVPSRFAMEEAADLARRFEAELTLLHIYDVPPVSDEAVLASLPEHFEQAVLDIQRKLDLWRADAEKVAQRPVSSTVLPGVPAQEIVRFVHDPPFDLLVVATHGRTGLRRLALGSIAERIVREAPCPVLVVRHRT